MNSPAIRWIRQHALRLFLIGLAGFILWGIAFPVYSDPGISPVISQANSEARQVGLAMKLYAVDHQGRLPEALEQLTPQYLPDAKFFPRTYLTTPGLKLEDLPPATIVVIKTANDPKRNQARVVFVRADMTIDIKRP